MAKIGSQLVVTQASERPLVEFADFQLQGASPQNVMKRVSALSIFCDKPLVRAVIARASSMGLISKQRLKRLYLSQTDGSIKSDPLFRLCDYAEFVRDGKPIFSFNELMLLEEARHNNGNLETYENTTCVADVAFFIRDDENRKRLSDSTLLRYHEGLYDADDAAIVEVELVHRKLLKLSESSLQHKLWYAAKESPQGNGVKVYLALLLGKAVRKGSSRVTIVEAIIQMIRPNNPERAINLAHAQSILALYLYNPAIPDEDKVWVKAKIQKSCDIYSRMYKEFVKDVEEGNPLRLKK